jgi:D-alanyl-lipoteichoic acid acyltransferase DltB (MBOAT superfamily)
MLFSSPDYPVFLIATFFLYGLARWGGRDFAWGRYAVMILLGDVVVMLVAKDPDVLWDPVGGILLRLATGNPEWPAWLFVHFAIGGALLAGAIAVGRRYADEISSARGQKWIGLGFAGAILAVGATAIAAHGMPAAPPPIAIDDSWPRWFASWLVPMSALDSVTQALIEHAHLAVLGVLGVGIGAARRAAESGDDAPNPFGRVVVLFVVSALFYHAWAAAMPGLYRYLLFLLLGTIVLDYYLGLWIERARTPAMRKLLLIVSLCSNLGILFFFKYYDFFLQDIVSPVTGRQFDELKLILPAGISFHTFQSLSYTIDVYRKQIPATRSAIEFATFVLFFPQLVAGPIVRAHDLLPQLAKPPPLDLQRATDGLFRIVIGLFKKIALADTLALSIVDRVFMDPSHFSSVEVLCGVYAYALQIYLDFSAYSDIAIGSAQILGFDLPVNFRTPYRSANLQEFWRRWHISLSTWLRDYLYIALGGSRGSELRTYFNLSATMLLGGLWHGASWAFIVWGALHGFGLAVTRFFQRSRPENAWKLAVACSVVAAIGYGVTRTSLWPEDIWYQLLIAWLAFTPLWAVLTAWLGRDVPATPEPVEGASPLVALFRGKPMRIRDTALIAELLRIAMCAVAIWFLLALRYAEPWTWIPAVLVMWSLAVAADLVERPPSDWLAYLLAVKRRTIAVVLVFHYVCLAWVFFRATTFDNALAILRQIAEGSTDHANLIPMITTALVVGFSCHFFADGSFRWLRRRFVELPAPALGILLAIVALVLRELAQHDIVPFIYFQF